ncbi:hypothetical protein T484DRAFT_1835872 [Baffinella frigidus]|nr:hypothetical protein T484DRAFT_1835872 [Cryptophyta sp. CCMP2293]
MRGRDVLILMTARGVPGNVHTYTHLIPGRDVLTLMTARGVPGNVYTYTNLIDACAKAAAEKEAEEFFAEMEAAGVAPNVVTFAALTSLHARTARLGNRAAPAKALRMLDRMRAAGVVPNAHAFGAAVDALRCI